jgi:multiple sugar transport system ATP-binding protein
MRVAGSQTNGEGGSRAQRLTVRGLNKWFGPIQVVKDLDIEVEPGEFLVLLGPSGCGKTTALRMIAGLEQADGGQILLGDVDVTHVLPKYRDVAMVFQSYALYPHKTVAENIGFPLKVRGVPLQERASLVREAAAQVHMDMLLDRYPRQLSGGQRQRVALARAIVRRPAVFLMDEPLSNLDAKLRGYMRAELKHMQHALGVTTIYVTHDQVEAMTLAHRVVVMDQGVLRQIGTPREVYDRPANLFVAGFIGSPPMNFVTGDIEDGAFVCANGRVPLAGVAPRSGVVLGFRPEDARICGPQEAQLTGTVFSAEMTGNETIVTCTVGKGNVIVKADKDFERAIDAAVHIAATVGKACVFDAASGERIRA